MLERVSVVPGVETASYVNFLPVTGVGVPTRLTIPGYDAAEDEVSSAKYHVGSPDCFSSRAADTAITDPVLLRWMLVISAAVFVGLIVPHVMRSLVGVTHRRLLGAETA